MPEHKYGRLGAFAEHRSRSSGPTGPRTEAGRLRSSLNAVRHGLGGQHILLPGEDATEYERRMDAVFISLDPLDEAQAQLVALIGDDMWRLDRLGRIEAGIALGRIEELLAQTEAARRAAALANATTALGTVLVAVGEEELPEAAGAERHRRVRALQDALDFVSATEPSVAMDAMQTCSACLMALGRSTYDPTTDARAWEGAVRAARVVMAELLALGDRVEAALADLRRAIATIALPDDRELSKLGRYRKALEEGLQRRLQCLSQLRTLGAPHDASHADQAREFRVRLRVVR